MEKNRKEQSAAVLTVFDAPRMTAKGKHDIALWLRRQAAFLEREGGNFAKRFTARYLYAPKNGEKHK